MAAPARAGDESGDDDDSRSVDRQACLSESTSQFAEAAKESSEEEDGERDDGSQFEQQTEESAASPAQKSSAVSDLIFSSGQANHQFNHILTALKRANLSMHNRLRSIQADALFVQDVQRAYYYNRKSSTAAATSSSRGTGVGRPRPLIANERCGSWYIPPKLKRGSAYFKSTDGHHGIWAFSMRRLNLHLLDLIGRHDGCIVVDSTRRGKRMPDALSKTVPMWCCVVNSVLFPEGVLRTGSAALSSSRGGDGEEEGGGGDKVSAAKPHYEPHRLYTPPNAVAASEHAQMEARVPAHADALRRLGLDLAPYRAVLSRPLRPVWVTQESRLDIPEDDDDDDGDRRDGGVVVFDDFHPVICCTSSRRVAGGEMSEGGYIQGAGDDTENWAFGLTPPVFWANADLLLSTPETELPDLVRSLVDRANAAPTPREAETDTAAAAAAVTASVGEASSLHSSSLASILSRYQQVAPGIFVARTADLDPRLLTASTSSSLPFSKGDKDSGNSNNNPLCTIVLHQQAPATDPSTWAKSPTHMDVGLGGRQSKIASRNLRAALPQVAEFTREFLERTAAAVAAAPAITETTTMTGNDQSRCDGSGSGGGGDRQEPRILIACDTGRDLSVGVALALVCQHCCTTATTATATTTLTAAMVTSGSGGGSGGLDFRPRRDTDGVNKTLIKSRLGHIMTRFPDGNPSRATLQSVNSYLMG